MLRAANSRDANVHSRMCTATDCDSLRIHVVHDEIEVRKQTRQVTAELNPVLLEYPSKGSFLQDYDGEPGILVTDLTMDVSTGSDLQSEVANREFFLPTVIVTGFSAPKHVAAAIRAGASAFVAKPCSDEELSFALHTAVNDYRKGKELYETARDFRRRIATLTKAEHIVFEMILDGRLNKQIAASLDVSVRTVEARRKKMLSKLEAANILDLLRKAACFYNSDIKFGVGGRMTNLRPSANIHL